MVTSRTVNNIIGKVLVMVARIRVFMYPAIYMSQYDVVKNALMGIVKKTAAKFSCTTR